MALTIYGTKPHGQEELRHQGPVPWTVKDPAPVTVVIPTIPVRVHQLNRALKSIQIQELQPAEIIVQVDSNGEGAPTTRNKGLQHVKTKFVTFLDDDDYLGKRHIRLLHELISKQWLDYVYPWFTIAGPSIDPFPQFFRKPWKDSEPHQTTIVTMVRTDLAQEVGFREQPDPTKLTPEGHTYGEDFQFTMECLEKGAKIEHLPIRTWFWVVTGWNTSGRPEKWRESV